MLTAYRRHLKSCRRRDEGRSYRNCRCPIWVDGILGGAEMRESLKVRDWQRAQEIIREWEIENRRTSQLTRKSDRKSTRLNSSHQIISYAVFCLKKKKNKHEETTEDMRD